MDRLRRQRTGSGRPAAPNREPSSERVMLAAGSGSAAAGDTASLGRSPSPTSRAIHEGPESPDGGAKPRVPESADLRSAEVGSTSAGS